MSFISGDHTLQNEN